MICNESTRIQRYHDRECPPAERLQAEGHLGQCADCRQLLAELQSLSRLVAARPAAPLPLGLLERLVQRKRDFEDRAILRIAGWMTATAAGILLAAILSWPTNGAESAAQPASWESFAVVPHAVMSDDPDAELLIMAQWMDHDLSSNESELR